MQSCVFDDVVFFSTDLGTACHVHTELVSDIGYKVQAVLVEEDEEEDAEEHEEHMAETQPGPFAFATEPVQTEAGEQEHDDKEEKKEEQEEDKEGFKQEAESAVAEMAVVVMQEEERAEEDGEENNQSENSQVPAEPVESTVTGSPLFFCLVILAGLIFERKYFCTI